MATSVLQLPQSTCSESLYDPSGHVEQSTIAQLNVWALLIGIEEYADPAIGPVRGAEVDVAKVRRYLIDLEVPEGNIVSLRNEEATREQIISTFRSHLIDNKDITKGDPLLFHFSGHGDRCKAPESWPIVERDSTDANKGLLEVIIPYDGNMPDDHGEETCGIPDRTLAILLELAAKAHGENMTVVLDCCHSGHGTRGSKGEGFPFEVRSPHPARIAPLREDVDKELLVLQCERGSARGINRGAFTELRARSHVLVAACGQDEKAQGDADGGLLTRFWLEALQSEKIHPRSYSEIVKFVDHKIQEILGKWNIKQHPQCEGITRDRLVFQDVAANRERFSVTKLDRGQCKIEAGKIHGVTTNTIFELYELDPATSDAIRTLGTAVAVQVDSDKCTANLAEGLQLAGDSLRARIIQQIAPLEYALLNRDTGSPHAAAVQKLVEEKLHSIPQEMGHLAERVDDPSKAIVVLEIDGRDRGGITLVRRDVVLRDLGDHPRLDREDVENVDIPRLLVSVSRFNYHLSRENDLHPFAEEVHFGFHLLESGNDAIGPDGLPAVRALKEEIPSKNDEIRIALKEDDDYAFVLRNSGPTKLFAYMFFFDAGTYEIENCYSPFQPDIATLLPGKTLQIGASAEHRSPFKLFIRDGEDHDTVFVKVFLLDNPADLRFMTQEPAIGCDEAGERNILRDGNPQQKGEWDCIRRKITIERRTSVA